MSSAGPSTAAPTAPQTFTPFIAYFFEDEPDDFVGHRAFFASGVIASLSDTRTGGLRFDLGQNSYTYTYILEAGLGAVLPVWDTTEADGSVIKLNGEEAMRIIDPRSFRAYQRKTEFSSVTNPNLPEVEGFVETMSGTGSPLLLYAAGSINETVAAQLVEEKAGLLHRELKSCLVRGMFSKEFPSLLSDGLLTRINLGDQWGTQ